ncbi:hypothetical protein D3C86_1900450 [compost metagenome]
MPHEGLHGAGHQPPALEALTEPVAQDGGAVRPVDPVVPDDARQLALMPDPGMEAVALGELPQGQLDEGPGVLDRAGQVHPGQPLAEVRAVAVDQGEEGARMACFEQAKFGVVSEGTCEHG